jgi:hypothetical protein
LKKVICETNYSHLKIKACAQLGRQPFTCSPPKAPIHAKDAFFVKKINNNNYYKNTPKNTQILVLPANRGGSHNSAIGVHCPLFRRLEKEGGVHCSANENYYFPTIPQQKFYFPIVPQQNFHFPTIPQQKIIFPQFRNKFFIFPQVNIAKRTVKTSLRLLSSLPDQF